MAIQAGYNAAVEMTTIFGGLSIHSTAFTYNYRSDINMYETFQSQFKNKEGGTQDVTGSCSGLCNDSSAAHVVTHSSFKVTDFRITYGSGRTLTFNAVLSNISLSKSSPGGPLEMSFDFESNGTVAVG